MLRELPPDNPVHDANVALVAAAFFLVCGIQYERLANFVQRGRGQSDKIKDLGIRVMRPLAFLFVALCLLFALILRLQ